MNKTQKGFALIESLLIILILTIIGFGGYYVWHTQKTTDKTNADTLKASQSLPAPSSSTPKYLTIKEYGVKFQLSDKISDAYYVKGTSGYLYFSLHRLDTLKGAENCAAKSSESASGIESLIVAKLGEDTGAPGGGVWTQSDLDNSGLKKVGDAYYGFQRGNAPCYDVENPPSSDFLDTLNGYIQSFVDQIPTFTKA